MLRAEFPKEVNQAVQYGIEAKSQMAYLNHEQHIPLKRTCAVFEEFYGHRPAEGTIYAAGAEAAELVRSATEAIKRLYRKLNRDADSRRKRRFFFFESAKISVFQRPKKGSSLITDKV